MNIPFINLKSSTVNQREYILTRQNPIYNMVSPLSNAWESNQNGEIDQIFQSRLSQNASPGDLAGGAGNSRAHRFFDMSIDDCAKLMARPFMNNRIIESQPLQLEFFDNESSTAQQLFEHWRHGGNRQIFSCLDGNDAVIDRPFLAHNRFTLTPNRQFLVFADVSKAPSVVDFEETPRPDNDQGMYFYHKQTGKRVSDIINWTPDPVLHGAGMREFRSNCYFTETFIRGGGSDTVLSDVYENAVIRGARFGVERNDYLTHNGIVNMGGLVTATRKIKYNLWSLINAVNELYAYIFIPTAIFTKYWAIGPEGVMKDCQLFPMSSRDSGGSLRSAYDQQAFDRGMKATNIASKRSGLKDQGNRRRFRQTNVIHQELPDQGLVGSFTPQARIWQMVNTYHLGTQEQVLEWILSLIDDLCGSSIDTTLWPANNHYSSGAIMRGLYERTDWIGTDEPYLIIADDYILGFYLAMTRERTYNWVLSNSHGRLHPVAFVPIPGQGHVGSLEALWQINSRIASRSSIPVAPEIYMPFAGNLSELTSPEYLNPIKCLRPNLTMHLRQGVSNAALQTVANDPFAFAYKKTLSAPNFPVPLGSNYEADNYWNPKIRAGHIETAMPGMDVSYPALRCNVTRNTRIIPR